MRRAVQWFVVLAAVALAVGLTSGPASATPSHPQSSHVHRSGPLAWRKPVSIDPSRGGFDSVSCASANFCLAGDRSGAIYRYAHGRWSLQTHLAGGHVGQLSCVSRTFCAAAIGRIQHPYHVLVYNGHRWQRSAGAPVDFISRYSDDNATGLSCVGPKFCLLVNTNGQYQRWDGRRWTKPRLPSKGDDGPDGLSCTRYLCGEVDEQGLAAIWHGTKRGHARRIAGLRDLVSVSCRVRDCWAIDHSGRSYRYSGGSWRSAGRVGVSADFANSSLSCYAVGRCVATDAAGNAYTLTKTGWQATPAVLTPVASRVDCASADLCVAVGRTGQSVVRRDGRWQAARGTDPRLGDLQTVSCANAHFCVAGDARTGVTRFDGTSWSRPHRLTFEPASINSISCPVTGFCMAVGHEQRAWRFENGRWSAELPLYLTDADSVSCSSADRCMATGLAKYAVSYYDGTSWTRIADTPFPNDFADEAACVAAGCFVLTDGGDVWRYDGTTWTLSKHLVDYAAGASLACVDSYCLASFNNDDVFQYADGAWSRAQDSFDDGPSNLSCGSPRLCAGLDYDNHVHVRVGRRWPDTHRLPGTSALTDVSCVGRVECIVVDALGHADIGRDVAPVPAPVAVATRTLPAGRVGFAYSATLTGSGGVGRYTWKLVAGGVPTGLTLMSNGTISGTPTATGTWSLTPQAADADGYVARRTLSIKVEA